MLLLVLKFVCVWITLIYIRSYLSFEYNLVLFVCQMNDWMIFLVFFFLQSLEEEMATHSSTLAWKIPWTKEPGRLQSLGSQRVGHVWATSLFFLSQSLTTLKNKHSRIFRGVSPEIGEILRAPQCSFSLMVLLLFTFVINLFGFLLRFSKKLSFFFFFAQHLT